LVNTVLQQMLEQKLVRELVYKEEQPLEMKMLLLPLVQELVLDYKLVLKLEAVLLMQIIKLL
jgi:cell division inhibitor SulA